MHYNYDLYIPYAHTMHTLCSVFRYNLYEIIPLFEGYFKVREIQEMRLPNTMKGIDGPEAPKMSHVAACRL